MFGTANAPTTACLDRDAASQLRVLDDAVAVQNRARSAYVAEIKAQVENGTYRPNLKVVAERLLADLATPYDR